MASIRKVASVAVVPILALGIFVFGGAQTTINQATVDPYYFGAAGNGVANDSIAFANAVRSAARQGKPLLLNGSFLVTQTIFLDNVPSGILDIRGYGKARIITHGQNLLQISPSNIYGTFKFRLEDFDVVNGGSASDVGTVLTVDCTAYGNFCTGDRSRISDVHLINTGALLAATETTLIDVRNSGATHSTSSSVEVPFITINPSDTATCSSGLFVDNNVVVGGSFVVMNGCVQGDTFTRNNHLFGYVGIVVNNPRVVLGMQLTNNYLEELGFGIFATEGSGWQITNNSFDANPNGVSPNYQAIVIGSVGNPVSGSVVSGNVAYDFAGKLTNTIFYGNLNNASVFSNNTVNGLINTSQCMSVGTDDNSKGNSPALTITGNTCWASGVIHIIGSTPLARANEYYLSGSLQEMNKVELN